MVLKEIGHRLMRYRLNRNLKQSELAKEAGVSVLTLHHIEKGESTQVTSLIRILRALRLMENIEVLVPEPGVSPIQQVDTRGKPRQRASSKLKKPSKSSKWTWGDDK